MLADCAWATAGSQCAVNAFDDPRQAEGQPNASPVDGFVSLNGGALRCRWSGVAKLELGMVVELVEVGAGTSAETHRLRACADAAGTQCGTWATTTKHGQTHPAGDLLF